MDVKNRLRVIKFGHGVKKYIRRFEKEHLLFGLIEIETINRCNGLCSFCPVNAREKQRPYAKMTQGLFEKIIGELSELDYHGVLSLFSNNEPFLDKRMVEFAKIARNRVPGAYINIATNGSLLSVEKMARIYPFIDHLVIDNYSDCDCGGGISQNIKDILNWKAENDAADRIQLVMRKQNEVLTSRGGAAPNKHNTKTINCGCYYPFIQMVVRPDGKCSLCCNDALGRMTLGDVNNLPLKEIWNSQRYRDVRIRMKKQQRKGIPLCQKCDTMYNAALFVERHKK